MDGRRAQFINIDIQYVIVLLELTLKYLHLLNHKSQS